jgi:hypothetical protein
MSAYNKFNQFARDVLEAKHDFGSHVFRVILTNTAPVASNTVRADIAELPGGNGYTSGGSASAITVSIAGGIAKVSGGNVVFTAAGGSMGPFRYAVLYNDSAVGDPLIAWFDYGSSITLANTEQFTVAFDATTGIFTLS